MTRIILMRHSQPLNSNIVSNDSSDSDQVRNEKNILTPEGEKRAEELAKKDIFKDIDVLYSSNYVRTMSTAKYIAFNNN